MSDAELPASIRTEGAHLVTWAADGAEQAEAACTPYEPGTFGAEALRLRRDVAAWIATLPPDALDGLGDAPPP